MNPTLSIKSKIAGKNADVHVYPDRIEYGKSGLSGGKMALGVATGGFSFLGTGFNNKKSATVLPIKAINLITAKRDGLVNTVVTFHTSGGSIEVKCSHSDAKELQQTVQRFMMG